MEHLTSSLKSVSLSVTRTEEIGQAPHHVSSPEPESKLLVSPVISSIAVSYIILYISPFDDFELWLT